MSTILRLPSPIFWNIPSMPQFKAIFKPSIDKVFNLVYIESTNFLSYSNIYTLWVCSVVV